LSGKQQLLEVQVLLQQSPSPVHVEPLGKQQVEPEQLWSQHSPLVEHVAPFAPQQTWSAVQVPVQQSSSPSQVPPFSLQHVPPAEQLFRQQSAFSVQVMVGMPPGMQQTLSVQFPLQQSPSIMQSVWRLLQHLLSGEHALPVQHSAELEHVVPRLMQHESPTHESLQQSASFAHVEPPTLQHASLTQACSEVQLSGQVTITPQLFIAVPPHCVAQALPLSKQQLFAPTPPPPQTPPVAVQVSLHVTVWPQLFFVGPQASPLHAVVTLSGVQHVSLERQTSPELQEPPQGIVMPHVTRSVLQMVLPHALASTVQQVPPSSQNAPPVQLPQETSAPQLLIAVPQFWPLHVFDTGSGVQSHALETHVPPSQPPQSMASPQLSVVDPHRPMHQVSCDTGVQHVSDLQTPPSPQVHETPSPHVSVTFTPQRLPHVTLGGGGVQHVPPSSQTSVECSQLAVPSTPQPTT
jgi:hypothetical protein